MAAAIMQMVELDLINDGKNDPSFGWLQINLPGSKSFRKQPERTLETTFPCSNGATFYGFKNSKLQAIKYTVCHT